MYSFIPEMSKVLTILFILLVNKDYFVGLEQARKFAIIHNVNRL